MKNTRLTPFLLFALSILILNAAGWLYFVCCCGLTRYEVEEAGEEQVASQTNGIPSVHIPAAHAPTNTAQLPKALYLTSFNVKAASFGDPELSVCFSEQPDLKDILQQVRSSPAVDLTITPLEWRWESGFRITGPFKHGELYTLTFSPNLKTSKGLALGKEIQRSVLIPHRQPDLDFDVPGRYLAPQGKLTIPVRSVNCTSLVSTVSRVLPQNLVTFAKNDSNYSYRESDAENTEELTQGCNTLTTRIPNIPNKEQRSFLHLAAQIPDAQKGVFLIELSADTSDMRTRSRLVCVTDIGISVREEPDAYTVWTTSLAKGSPTADHSVTLYGRNNALLAQGKTDKDGFARLKFDARNGTPFLLVVAESNNEDFTFLALDNKNEVEQLTKTQEPYLPAKGSEAFVFTDREIYRHGETLFVQALLRKQDNTPPAPFPVLLEVVKPNGKSFKTVPLIADACGCVTTEITLPEHLPSGTYRARLSLPGENAPSLGETRFSLESFVPPQIRVKHRELPDAVNAGALLTGRVEAEHLFGKPADGLKFATTVLFKPMPLKLSAWEDYLFGDEEKTFTVQRSQQHEGHLDINGQATFTNEIPKNLLPPARLDAIVQSSVIEMGGRAVTARATVPVHPYPFYIGIRNEKKNILRAGKEQTLQVAAVLPDGKRKAEPVALVVKLEQVSWISNLRKDSRGYYQWESERIKSLIFTNTFTCAEGGTAYRFSVPADTGDYLITFSDPSSQSSTSWRFTSSENTTSAAAWDRSSPDHVKLVLDKEAYLPGETVRLQIRAPFSGVAWVTLQQTHILENQVIVMTNNTAEVTWKAHKAWSPNLEVAVSVIRPATAESVWSAHRASGITSLCVTPAEHKLNVSVTTTASVALPKTTLPVTVAVTTASGQPAQQAAVTLLAVDEGICMLTDMKTPSPYSFFKRIRTAGLSFYDIFSQLMPITDDSALDTTSHVGGDGEEDFAIKRLNPIASRRFKPVSLWKGNVTLDANGKATIPLPLPEFTGELRLMAVAWDRQGTGSADSSIKVKRNLIVQPDLPRFLAPQDRAQFPVTLHNESGKPLSAQLSALTDGPVSIDLTNQVIQLAAAESRTVLLNATAREEPGLSHVRIIVEGAGDRYDESIELAVRPPTAWEEKSEHSVLKPGEERSFQPDKGILPATFSQTLYASTRPSINLVGALEYVVTYPYGCLEQTTSSVFPLIPLKELSTQVTFKNTTLGQEAPDLIDAALARILSMQRYDGFAMWPGSYGTARYESVYASHFIIEAANSGYKVPADLVPFCVQFLESELRNERCVSPAYVCHVLALAKHPAHNTMLRLFEETHALSTEDRFHLARALLRSGDIPKARGVLETVKKVKGLREAAFGILAWCELDPAAPMVVACTTEIEKNRTRYGHWGTTQNNALGLLALGRLTQYVTASPRTETLSLEWNGIATQRPATNSATWTSTEGATLKNVGAEPVYVTRMTRAVPLQSTLLNQDEGIVVRRTFLSSSGAQTNATTLSRGDLLRVEISIDPQGNPIENLVIEDLLPAGLELEMGADLKAPVAPESWVVHREARDDRLILFAKPIKNLETYRYAVRAVTSGEFVVPAISASAMYDPGTFSRHGATRLTIK